MRILAAMLVVAASQVGLAQSLTGRWAAVERALDNGEQLKVVLALQQSGDKVTGKLTMISRAIDVSGTVTGKHFELYGSMFPKRPFLTGDLEGSDLHLVVRGTEKIVAHPATAADEIAIPAYIAPPALHDVASNGLAKTPPMGWNSWNLFAGKIDQETVKTMADAMVSSGMKDAGYIYVNIDDTWEGVRDAQGNLPANHKFPDMKALGDYVHSKGLKLGIYSSPGPRTCGSYPGSYGFEAQDAKMFASWGIDYLKYDWCGASLIYKNDALQPVYQKMGEALQATGRPMIYSLCEYGMGSVEKWGPNVGANLWRTTGDIRDSFDSMIENVEKQVPTAAYAGPGHWNDPDMLEVGNGHMTADEYRIHMSLWALVAAPLLAGNDIRSMTDETKSILLNKEVIAIDQDSLGKQASPVKNGDLETWVKPLADGSVAVGVVNLGTSAANATIKPGDLGFRNVKGARDLWAHADVSFKADGYSAMVPSHGVLLLRVVKAD
jgi:alpha-galactosidase